MKPLLNVAAGESTATEAEEQEVTGEVLAIRGGRPLTGRVEVKGAKNLVTKAMVAALLGETVSTLRDVPDISDVHVVRSLLEVHGVRVDDGDEEGTFHFDPSGAVSAHFEEIDAHAGASRIPILFCGPLLHLLGEALIPDLGGCRIGDRPINFHMDALRAFGAVVDKSYEGIRITAPNGLHGANIELPYPSVGATEQVLLTAVLAEGVTELRNAAVEPEIVDLICVLGGDPERPLVTMRARELGRTPIVVGDEVSVVGDLSGKPDTLRSEERRVGKECRSRWSPYH